MKKSSKKSLYTSIVSLSAFVVWTVLLKVIDVKAIGPNGSSVGFAKINGWFHNLTGVNLKLYNITDWLGLVPIAFCLSLAILGLMQWLKRKNLLKVDYDILILGGFYLITAALYFTFETIVINYRPTLINGYLEASYPSSTTLLVMCAIPTAIMQLNSRIKSNKLKSFVTAVLSLFIVFMVIARLVSGVHWLTDIVGGVLLSLGLVTLYRFIVNIYSESQHD